MATEMTTTEETETTKTVTSEDVRGLAREDVSGDVTRSVAERGGYAVSFGCTSGAGTGSSKQTTETSEETETFCRGYHYGNGHRDDHDGDSDERGRESLGTRRLWLNAVATLFHLPVRVARARDRASRQPRRPRRRRRVVEGTTTEMATEMTTTAETENDGDSDERGRESLGTRRLTSEDVSGDVARRVAERGGYAVSSGCTSGAGTGSSKPTTEMSEETETFWRGYHYGNGHRDDHDGDSDERGRESLDTRRREWRRDPAVWLNAAAASHLAVRGRARDRAKPTTETSEETETLRSRVPLRKWPPRDDHDGGNGNDGDSDERDEPWHAKTERDGPAVWLNAVLAAVSSAHEWGAGTDRASRQSETIEETETFCRGYHYGNGHRDDHDGGNGKRRKHVAERGGYAVSSACTSGAGTGSIKPTTETSEETETFCRGYHYGNGYRDDHDGGSGNDGDSDERGRESLGTRRLTSEDVRALAREDVSGDVTRSVAERGGYAVSSGCTSGAGTGSSKQTTETSEETETFCRGYHYGNGHRDDHDGGNGKRRRQ
ncbi:hypothetical protein GN958_ATG16248 [Phytophthora infestans]|uniref:Uncharacterized protein n=1 Tax=Phytophthora infestans TaxID=4787 RepID=A0A8S9U4I2_PHYIN|nr:hypothetical protein GN958_ATG16248 [Phytophthora infestans]